MIRYYLFPKAAANYNSFPHHSYFWYLRILHLCTLAREQLSYSKLVASLAPLIMLFVCLGLSIPSIEKPSPHCSLGVLAILNLLESLLSMFSSRSKTDCSAFTICFCLVISHKRCNLWEEDCRDGEQVCICLRHTHLSPLAYFVSITVRNHCLSIYGNLQLTVWLGCTS